VFQKGRRIFNMSTIYDGTLLDHLAEHISTSPMLLASGLV